VTLPTTPSRIGDLTMRRMRDYAVDEPSFTAAFMAWELGLSAGVAHEGVKRLLAGDIIEQIEPRSGPYAAVYRYKPIEGEGRASALERERRSSLFRELDDSRLAGVGAEAQPRGNVVPHTRARGSSGRPGRDRKLQESGVTIKRARQGT
jgi:hypothetical protein